MEDSTPADCTKLNPYPESSVADFAASIACTETPDLRDWFSSYVYQSPELSSRYCFEDSIAIEGESKHKGLYVEDSEGEDEHTRSDYTNIRNNYPPRSVKKFDIDECSLHELSDECDRQHKVPEYSDSPLSEPLDIRNWFSSYVYESPELHTAEIGGSLTSITNNDDTEDNVGQEEAGISTPIKIKGDILPNKSIHTDAFVKERDLVRVKNEPESSKQENGLEDLTSDFPYKSEKFSNPGQISCCAVKAAVDERDERDNHKDSSTKISSDKATKPEDKSSNIDDQTNLGWVLPNPKKRGNTSTMKVNPKKHEREETSVSLELRKGPMTTRMPLMEISNVLSSDSNEIAGKWRCPQKSKPYNRPPLKQLRLEKWIQRL